ncbi:MAG: FAD-dependent monooxygenase, partial [Trebonia sp.]
GLGLAVMSPSEGADLLSSLFAEQLNGYPLLARLPDGKSAAWLNFPTVTNRHWHFGNLVLLGDSAHTAHYSLGQGTKMAVEDAIVLADSLTRNIAVEAALRGYEARRKEQLARALGQARCSARWFENISRYTRLSPREFAALLESRRSPLVQVLPPPVSYRLQRAVRRSA